MGVTCIWAGAPTDTSFAVAAKVTGASVRLVLGLDPLLIGAVKLAAASPDANGWVNGARQAELVASGLAPNTRYYYALEVDGVVDTTKVGTVKTFPPAGRPANVKLLAASCMDGRFDADAGSIFSNSTIYPKLPAWHPDALAFVMMGDLHYSDIGQENQALYRAAFEGVLAQPNVQALMLKMPIIYQPDDHDYGPNDPTRLSPGIAAFQAAYRQCVPSYPLPSGTGLLYQSVPIGRSLLIVTDLRGARDAYTAASPRAMLGAEQMAWFTNLLATTGAKAILWESTSSTVATIGVGNDPKDTWAYHVEEAAAINAAVASYLQRGAFGVMQGDNHALCMDIGGSPFGATVPTWGFAALDGWGNFYGGPYSLGYSAGGNRYGIIEIADDGAGIVMTGTGYIGERPWRSLSTAYPPSYTPAKVAA